MIEQWIQEALRSALSQRENPNVITERRGRGNSEGLARKALAYGFTNLERLTYEKPDGTTQKYFVLGVSALSGIDELAPPG